MAPIQPVNQLPTPPSTTSDRRSDSYISHHDDTSNNINTKTNTTNSSSTLGSFSSKTLPTSSMDMQMREYHNSIKATLTALLNNEQVRQSPDSTKCVQAGLLEIEQDLRREKRKSLGIAPPDEKL